MKTIRFFTTMTFFALCMVAFTSKTMAQFADGDGSIGNPYQIATAEQLESLAIFVNDGDEAYNDKHYKLTADIDLSDYGVNYNDGKGWIPIGHSDDYVFMGHFDGNNKTISNLYIDNTADDGYNNTGLFGWIDMGTIRNLGIVNADINGISYVGAVVGYVTDCSIDNCYSTGTINGDWSIGGLIGELSRETHLTNSYSTAIVSGSEDVGGVAGCVYVGTITHCYSTGTVSGDEYVGGIVGYMDEDVIVANCYSTGTVIGEDGLVGGIVGYGFEGGSISNCYSISTIIGDDDIVGGIASLFYDGNVTNCVALNPSIKSGDIAVRIAASDGILSNNLAWDGILNAENDTIWNYKGASNVDGEDITTEQINADGTFGGRFTVANGWTTENGKLPGLFGKTVDMPAHLILSNSIAETDNYPSLQVYPNPTSGQLTINKEINSLVIGEIEIYDVAGKLVFSYTSHSLPLISVDVSHLANGMYFLKAGNKTVKIVKE